MNNYTVTIQIPVLAVDDRAAQVAQLEIFQQLQLAMCRGIQTEEFTVEPVSDAQFTTKTMVGKSVQG